ncbi:hypothetical protein [Alloactinosynnema sp. L-07]|uniref:hypothetical protein n=1 Tax=Alloactinosynnema sp. L-07 TaxID=1653480 RepID=UPI00065EFA65|nr:hypothetical protein [Alloactinosynnema sp. L-07]CRK56973.1 hypothetical protein [Alloactinosynnema sp. L-07]
MSTRPSTGRRVRLNGTEIDMFDHRRTERPKAGEAKAVKTAANRRERQAGRQYARKQRWEG